MLVGVLLFAVNDTLGTFLLGTYAVGQLMLGIEPAARWR